MMIKILVLEDNKDLAYILTEYLRMEGYEVVYGLNGLEGLEFLKTHVFDFIITDLLMPEMDGIEFINKLKKLDVKPYIVALSGGGSIGHYGAESYLSMARKIGADLVLEKPYELKVIGNFLKDKKALLDT